MQAGQVSLKRLRVTRAIQTQNYQQNPPTSTVDLQVGYRYDTEGRVTCVQYPTTGRYATDPGLFYCYSYDSMSRIAGLSTYPGDPNYYWNSPTSAITGVTYGPANEMQQIQYAGGAIESRQYNSLLQMTRLTAPGVQFSGRAE